MLKKLAHRFDDWQERMSQRHGTDISTPKTRRAARWHLILHDHSFLRRYWTNLHEIAPGVWRSNQPSPERLRLWQRDLGLKSVLNLRGKHRLSHWLFEEEVCRKTGMQLVDYEMFAWFAPPKSEIEAVIAALSDLPRPVLFHCKSGADRTGIVAALYLALVENRPYAEIRQQVSFKYIHRDAGRTGVLDHVFRVYERDFMPKGISFGDWIKGPDYRPDAINASYTAWNANGRKGISKVEDRALPHGRWLWRRHLRGAWGILGAAFVLMAIEGVTMGALSWLIRPMFDEVFLGTDKSLVPLIALAIAGVFTLRALSSFGHQTLLARHSETLSAALQAQVLSHVMIQDIGFFRANPPGALIERVRGDALAFRILWQPIVTALGRDVIGFLALLAVALWTDWVWTLIAVIGAPLLSLPLTWLQSRVNRAAEGARAAAGVLTTRLDEIFHGITTIRLTGHEGAEAERYARALADYKRVQMRAETASAGIPALIDLVAAMGFAGVMTYGGYQIMAGEKTVGEFMSFFIAMALIFEPLRRLGAVSGQWAQARAALARMRTVLAITPSIQAPANPHKLDKTQGHRIEISDVHFAYDPASPVLRGLSLTAEPGQMTALVGPSGAGKSTIFGLIARIVDPDQGSISLDGTDLRHLDPADLRARIAVVTQDSALFDETIAWNVAMGNPDLGSHAVLSYLDQAQAADFVAQLPLGADTPVGPRGSALSGGQRQRVAIARALARQAPILLLDEATSALDAQTESLLSDRLAQPQPGGTTIVIAHRLATVRAADVIHVLDQGRVVESGNHEALIAKGGLYASLYALQFSDTTEVPS